MIKKKTGFWLQVALATAVCASTQAAEISNVEVSDRFCLTCHGTDGQGNVGIDAPRLAGMEPWYLKRQLELFRDGLRGTHPEDLTGQEMQPMAEILSDNSIEDIVEWVGTWEYKPAEITLTDGDAERGRTLYQTCASCHGAQGQGNEGMGAPALAGQNDWYLLTQLKNFKAGYRGYERQDQYGSQMRMMAQAIPNEQAMKDLVAYINTLGRPAQSNEENEDMGITSRVGQAAASVALAGSMAMASTQASAQDVIIHPNSGTFPIANAVEVGPEASIIFHSGVTPSPANPNAERGTPAYYGNTETQALSVFTKMKADLEAKGLSMGDVVKMTVFLVGDPAMDNRMDFSGFMNAYTQFWGTDEQPNLPARSAVQVAGLVAPLMFVEVEVITAKRR